MTRQQLETLLSSISADQCYIGDDAKEVMLDFAEAVQKAAIIEVLDVVQQALESTKQHILLKNQAG